MTEAKGKVLQFRERRPKAQEPAKQEPVVTQWHFQITAETVGPVPNEIRSELNQAVANAVSETMAAFGHMTVKGISDMHFDCRPAADEAVNPGFIIPLPQRSDD